MGLWALWLITQYKIQAFTCLISLEDIISLCIIKFHSQLSNYEFFFSVLCFFGILLVLQFFGHQLFKTIRVCLDSIQHLEFCVFSIFSGSRALFTSLQVLFFIKTLKLGLTVLFTHLKIILQYCFQYYLQDLQVLFFIKTLKLGLTVLFTHLKIILQYCFQFSVISGIQTDP